MVWCNLTCYVNTTSLCFFNKLQAPGCTQMGNVKMATCIFRQKDVPGYNHIQNDVSSLYAVDAHRRWFFQGFFIAASVLLLVFYIGLHRGLDGGSGSIVAPLLFIISASLGVIVSCFFPLDAGGELATWRGRMHLILIAASSSPTS